MWNLFICILFVKASLPGGLAKVCQAVWQKFAGGSGKRCAISKKNEIKHTVSVCQGVWLKFAGGSGKGLPRGAAMD